MSNTVDLADQIEAIISLLEENKSLSLSRIITFIDSNVLINLNVELRNWLDACAHFSDVFCFSGRKNNNSNLIKQITDRYESLYYPLETYILGDASGFRCVFYSKMFKKYILIGRANVDRGVRSMQYTSTKDFKKWANFKLFY